MDVGSGSGSQLIRVNGGKTNSSDAAGIEVSNNGGPTNNGVNGFFGNSDGYFGGAYTQQMLLEGFAGLNFSTNNVIDAALLQNGNFGIGTTSPDTLLAVGSATPVGNVAHFENSTGSCYINPTTTSLSCSSDARLKKNVADIDASTTLAALLHSIP